MNHDWMSHTFNHMVDKAVEVLLPRGSCSKDRWLTFDLEAVGDDDQTFRYLLQYRATSNYIDWRVVLPVEPHFRRGEDRHDRGENDGWVNINEMRGSSLRVLAKMLGIPATWIGTTFNRETVLDQIRNAKVGDRRVELAPGYVINSGCHDSCWRDHALSLEGAPWKLPEGERKFRERTIWMRSMRVSEVIVHSIKVEGKPGGMWQANDPKWEAFTDGEWINPEPEVLTGSWAVITGLACLLKTTGEEGPLRLDLDTSLRYYRDPKDGEDGDIYGRVATGEKRITVAYKIDDEGNLLEVGYDKRKVGMPDWEWGDVNIGGPISRGKHIGFCKVPTNKQLKDHVGINSMWAR